MSCQSEQSQTDGTQMCQEEVMHLTSLSTASELSIFVMPLEIRFFLWESRQIRTQRLFLVSEQIVSKSIFVIRDIVPTTGGRETTERCFNHWGKATATQISLALLCSTLIILIMSPIPSSVPLLSPVLSLWTSSLPRPTTALLPSCPLSFFFHCSKIFKLN